jgi:hypothetical protein
MALLSEADRQSIILLLQHARALVTAQRDNELGFVQAALEAHLDRTASGRERQVWLTAIDALIPSPYRAALVATKSALTLGATESLVDLVGLLRDRLLARITEVSLQAESTKPLFLTG